MKYGFCSGNMRRISFRGRVGLVVFLLITAFLFTGPAMALDFKFLDRQLLVNGFINQGVSLGVAGDSYTTKAGFQQALMQALLELDYRVSNDVSVFVSGQLTKDWAYDFLSDNDEWDFRRLSDSRSELGFYDDYEDILKECHVTWAPGDFNIRAGKQIVVWGRMDGVRLMDQINPRDVRRGFSDVEFETSIIPIWLIKTEYFLPRVPKFILDMGLEFTFNPNPDFIGDKSLSTGNDVYGIWSADVVSNGLRIGSIDSFVDEPDRWDTDAFEYAFRIKATTVDNTYFTLNYFDGVSNAPVARSTWNDQYPYSIRFDNYSDDKGHPVVHPLQEGYYADQRYAGFTFAREFESLYSSFLGGQAPLIRCEALYEFDTTFVTEGKGITTVRKEEFEEHDAIYWGMGVDWKFKWNLMNPRRYFNLVPQFTHRHIRDYPDSYKLAQNAENTYAFSARLTTQYLHDKLEPFAYYQRTMAGSVKSDLWLIKLSYLPNSTWKYTAALYLASGEGYEAVDHQDNVSLTVSYQF